MRDITFELCAETLAACLTAREGGAHRVELCADLTVGGLTPALSLVREAIAKSGLPIHTMIRPRAGNFVYTAAEFAEMSHQITHMKSLGATGVVFGLLLRNNTIDIERTRTLVALARPMQVTFHRAFDETPNPLQALEDIITIGCDRILTSGGQPDVLAGAPMLAELITQADARITIAAGGGLRHENASEVARLSGATHFHGSLRHNLPPAQTDVAPGDVRSILAILRTA